MGSAFSSSRYCSIRACSGLFVSGIRVITCFAGYGRAGLGGGSFRFGFFDLEVSFWYFIF